ncbi:hypothetical protein [Pseudomonas putida]|uniref:hypothetical protein n=1 Tax=Pseudomonas putida TaxID=303 RepID=UPI0013AF3506|nr:hypothetical protein [Pseudomonas putida]
MEPLKTVNYPLDSPLNNVCKALTASESVSHLSRVLHATLEQIARRNERAITFI